MISFDVLTFESSDAVLKKLCEKCPACDKEYLSDIIKQLVSLDDGCEYALSVASGSLLVRVFDEEYYFLFPEPLADEFELSEAIEALRSYTIREEIPLVICEVPGEYLEELSSFFTNTECECEDEEDDIYTVRALSEISLLEELPEESEGDVTISALSHSDEKEYAVLCRDSETNKYWGYNYYDDDPDCTDSRFVECAEAEFSRGVAASFAVKLGEEFAGEVVLYAFDLLGGAECAIRLLPQYRGRGLSKRSIELLCRAAKRLGLACLYATVDIRNEVSLGLFSKSFEPLEKDENTTRFLRKL